jgi:hypothetical protein
MAHAIAVTQDDLGITPDCTRMIQVTAVVSGDASTSGVTITVNKLKTIFGTPAISFQGTGGVTTSNPPIYGTSVISGNTILLTTPIVPTAGYRYVGLVFGR